MRHATSIRVAAVLATVTACQADQRVVTDVPESGGITAQTTSDVNSSGDTFLNIDSNNNSTGTTLNLYTWPDQRIANAIVIKFDLAGIPPGTEITSATLNLYLVESDAFATDPTYRATVHQIINKNPDPSRATGYTYDGTNPWTANACCANGAPLAQADIGPAVDTLDVDKAAGYKQWDVTALVQAWVDDPASNYGLLVNSDSSKLRDRFRSFASAETDNRPFLTVVYGDTIPPGPTGSQPQIVLADADPTGATFDVSWGPAIDQPSGQPVDEYLLDFGFNDGSWEGSDTSSGTSTQVHFPYATSDTTGWLCVKGVDDAGNVGPHWCNDFAVPRQPGGGGDLLADQYPCDAGIGSDTNVVWHEDFERGSVSEVTQRYEESRNPSGMAFDPDRPSGPSGPCGAKSMKFTAGGPTSGDDATHLYKNLANVPSSPTNGYEELYWRWYAKYQTGTPAPWHHTGVWFGGYNPPRNWPNPQAGTKPNGDDRFSITIEPSFLDGEPGWTKSDVQHYDFYNYWMKMHTCSSCGGSFWGNALLSRNNFTVDNGGWACVEVHAKLNTNPASNEGAVLEVWKNDALVQRFDETGERGYWVQDRFCPLSTDGSRCTRYKAGKDTTTLLDLQMRTTSNLKLNVFWPQNYISGLTPGSVWYDNMVVAKTRIGCLR